MHASQPVPNPLSWYLHNSHPSLRTLQTLGAGTHMDTSYILNPPTLAPSLTPHCPLTHTHTHTHTVIASFSVKLRTHPSSHKQTRRLSTTHRQPHRGASGTVDVVHASRVAYAGRDGQCGLPRCMLGHPITIPQTRRDICLQLRRHNIFDSHKIVVLILSGNLSFKNWVTIAPVLW